MVHYYCTELQVIFWGRLFSCHFTELISYKFEFLCLWWEGSLGFSLYKIISSVNRVSFPSSFYNLDAFISFSCLIFLASNPSTMLNRNGGKSGHLCLVPDLTGKALGISPLSMTFAMGF